MSKIQLYKENKITKDELLILYIIEEINSIEISELLMFAIPNTKEIINKLVKESYISIDYSTNIITINNSFKNNYIPITDSNVMVKDNSNLKQLTIEDIDQIRMLINREIKNYELELLKVWINDYTIEQIKDAIYKSLIKNIDNFKYIQKVLYNNEEVDKNPQIIEKKAIRKFDFFD